MLSRSQQGLLPFVELNGEHLADSQLIIAALSKHFNVEEELSPTEAVISWSLQRLVSQQTFFLCLNEKVKEPKFAEFRLGAAGLPTFLRRLLIPIAGPIMKGIILKRVGNVLGLFSDAEFLYLLKQDLDAYQNAIGLKKFIISDELHSVDFAVFGVLATSYYVPVDNTVKRLLNTEDYAVK